MITYMSQFDWNLIEGLVGFEGVRSPTVLLDRLCILTTPGLEALGEALLFFSMLSNKLFCTCMPNLRDS